MLKRWHDGSSCHQVALSEGSPLKGDIHYLYALSSASFFIVGFAILLVQAHNTSHWRLIADLVNLFGRLMSDVTEHSSYYAAVPSPENMIRRHRKGHGKGHSINGKEQDAPFFASHRRSSPFPHRDRPSLELLPVVLRVLRRNNHARFPHGACRPRRVVRARGQQLHLQPRFVLRSLQRRR